MAQQSLVTSLISRGVTCDADNLVDYQSDSTSTHTNCLIQLLKSGWLRSFVSTEARILRFPLLLSSGYFQKFSKFRLEILNNFNHLALPISRQREANSTALVAAVNTSFSPLSTEKIEPSTEPHNTALSTSSGLR
ncbi:hypothetical protein V0M98_29320 [Pseudomonas silesiensis]|uniref:hypothetical protein n=1 Tax=Pseudomonas silesiensis TaxID=1853130 RepID=UPI0030D5C5C9